MCYWNGHWALLLAKNARETMDQTAWSYADPTLETGAGRCSLCIVLAFCGKFFLHSRTIRYRFFEETL